MFMYIKNTDYPETGLQYERSRMMDEDENVEFSEENLSTSDANGEGLDRTWAPLDAYIPCSSIHSISSL